MISLAPLPALVYVIDANDRERLEESVAELMKRPARPRRLRIDSELKGSELLRSRYTGHFPAAAAASRPDLVPPRPPRPAHRPAPPPPPPRTGGPPLPTPLFPLSSPPLPPTGPPSETGRRVLPEDELRDAVLCVLCNKRDLPNALSGDEVARRCGGKKRALGRPAGLTARAAATGLQEALDWMADAVAGKMAADAAAGRVVPLPPEPVQRPPLIARAEAEAEAGQGAAASAGGSGARGAAADLGGLVEQTRAELPLAWADGIPSALDATQPHSAGLGRRMLPRPAPPRPSPPRPSPPRPSPPRPAPWVERFEASNGKTDGQLREDFEQGRLTYDTLGHGTLIRLLWLYLRESAAERARTGAGRKRAVDALLWGVERAWGRSRHEAAAREPHMAEFRAFLLANRFLAVESLVTDFYSRGLPPSRGPGPGPGPLACFRLVPLNGPASEQKLIFHDSRSAREFALPDLKARPAPPRPAPPPS
eukprot:tig00000806_g4368.t1